MVKNYMISQLLILLFMGVLLFTTDASCIEKKTIQGHDPNAPKSAAGIEKEPVSVSPAFEKTLAACNQKVSEYSNAVNSMTAAGCNRFGEDKYANALDAKNRLQDCAPFIKAGEPLARKQSADKAISDFAVQCVCRKRIDSIDANLGLLDKMQSEGCMGPTPANTLQQATGNINIIANEWARLCRGNVPASLDNDMRAKQQKASNSEARVAARCAVVDGCGNAVHEWVNAVKAVKQISDNKCGGLLYAAIYNAKGQKDRARQICQGPVWNALVSKDDEVYRDKLLTAAVLQCTTTNEVVNHRCPFSLESHITSIWHAGSMHKRTDVWVRQYWCAEEEDMTWCEKYIGGNVHVKLDKENWVVYFDKNIEVTVNSCVDPSEWRKCGTVDSSTAKCSYYYTKCKTYSKTTPGKCVYYE